MFHKVTDCWLITCHCYWISGTSTVEKAEEILLTWRKSKHCFCKCQVQILIFDFLFKCSMINLLITTPFSHTFKNIICSHQVGIYSTSVDNEAPSAGNGKKKKKICVLPASLSTNDRRRSRWLIAASLPLVSTFAHPARHQCSAAIKPMSSPHLVKFKYR